MGRVLEVDFYSDGVSRGIEGEIEGGFGVG